MLIRYKKNLEKIAMGLLSFMPVEKKGVKILQQTIHEYETNSNWHLFLWKEAEDVLGIIGIRIEEENKLVIQHISVNPSHRNMGIGKKMVNEIKSQYEKEYTIVATDETKEFYQKCMKEQSTSN